MTVDEFKKLILSDSQVSKETFIGLANTDEAAAIRLWLDLLIEPREDPAIQVVFAWQGDVEMSKCVRGLFTVPEQNSTPAKFRQILKEDRELCAAYRQGVVMDYPSHIKRTVEREDELEAKRKAAKEAARPEYLKFKALTIEDPEQAKRLFCLGYDNLDRKESEKWTDFLFDLLDEVEENKDEALKSFLQSMNHSGVDFYLREE